MNAKLHDRLTALDMHGRPVLVRPVSPNEKTEPCADCNAESTVVVYEVHRSYTQESKWFWCGECDIGG